MWTTSTSDGAGKVFHAGVVQMRDDLQVLLLWACVQRAMGPLEQGIMLQATQLAAMVRSS